MNTKLTKPTKAGEITRSWHAVDVKGKVLGRIATEIAQKLMGKTKTYFAANMDCGDFVVVTNAKFVSVTGEKEKTKLYGNFSGYPGGLKIKPLWKVREENPEELIRHAVLGMLPKNKLRDRLMTRLHVFAGAEHPYTKELEGPEAK